MEKVGNTLDSLNVTVSGVNKMLGEANQAHITRTLAHLETTMSDVKGVSNLFHQRCNAGCQSIHEACLVRWRKHVSVFDKYI